MSILTLSIGNPQQMQHGVSSHHSFDNRGGTIGSIGADWRLQDREQRVQPLHCEIFWSERRFCVIDRCGQTRLNNNPLSLLPLTLVRLQDGDCLRVGTYRLQVHIDQGNNPRQRNRHTLDDLLNEHRHPLDALLFDLPASPRHFEITRPVTLIDINQVFAPGIGCDPLAALEAALNPSTAGENSMHLFAPGETP